MHPPFAPDRDPPPPDDAAAVRERMVRTQIAARGVRDARVLDAMRAVPREAFVAPGFEAQAYDDCPLPIGDGQTISQPYVVAWMAEAAAIAAGDRVLEVGAGSGYAAAVLGRLAAHVVAVERHATLAAPARERLLAAGCTNVDVHVGDGSVGWPAGAPYDAIVVSAAAPQVPPALITQLAIGGRLVVPVGDRHFGQQLRRIVRVDADHYIDDDLGGVAFVPLVGVDGWGD